MTLAAPLQTSRPWASNTFKFELIYLNQNGRKLEVCTGLRSYDRVCSFYVYGPMPPNSSKPIEAPGNRFYPETKIPKGSTVSGFAAHPIEVIYSPVYVFDIAVKDSEHFAMKAAKDVESGNRV